jgi:hypothetical protein
MKFTFNYKFNGCIILYLILVLKHITALFSHHFRQHKLMILCDQEICNEVHKKNEHIRVVVILNLWGGTHFKALYIILALLCIPLNCSYLVTESQMEAKYITRYGH